MERRYNPWMTLARIAGPMMIWLSISFLLLTVLLENEWIRDSLQEVEPVGTGSLLLRSMVCAGIGIVLILWGYSGKSTPYLAAAATAGKKGCPTCGAELFPTTSVCPYCGRDVGLR